MDRIIISANVASRLRRGVKAAGKRWTDGSGAAAAKPFEEEDLMGE